MTLNPYFSINFSPNAKKFTSEVCEIWAGDNAEKQYTIKVAKKAIRECDNAIACTKMYKRRQENRKFR